VKTTSFTRTALTLAAISAGAAGLSLAVPALVRADLTDDRVPDLVPWSGALAKDGVAFDGTVELTFRVYDGAAASAPAWSERHTVAVADGRFDVLLGVTSATSAAELRALVEGADDLYVEVAQADGDGEIVFPGRRRLVAQPAATVAKALSAATVRRRLAVEGSVTVHDVEGAVLAITPTSVGSSEPLALNPGTTLGVTLGGDLAMSGGDLAFGDGASSSPVFSRVGDIVEIGRVRDYAKIVFEGDVTIDDEMTNALATTVTSGSGLDQDLIAQAGTTSGTYHCPDGYFIHGGRFFGDFSDGKTFKSVRCSRVNVEAN